MEQTDLNHVGKLRSALNKAIFVLNVVGTIWIGLLMFIIVADVVGRGVFNYPIQGVPEIVKNSIVGLTFLQISHVLKEGRHIRTTVLYDRANDTSKKIIDLVANVIGVIIFALLFYAILEPAKQAFLLKTFEGNAVRIPTFPTYLLILIGSFFMTLQFLTNIYDSLVKKTPNLSDENDELKNDFKQIPNLPGEDTEGTNDFDKNPDLVSKEG